MCECIKSVGDCFRDHSCFYVNFTKYFRTDSYWRSSGKCLYNCYYAFNSPLLMITVEFSKVALFKLQLRS